MASGCGLVQHDVLCEVSWGGTWTGDHHRQSYSTGARLFSTVCENIARINAWCTGELLLPVCGYFVCILMPKAQEI